MVCVCVCSWVRERVCMRVAEGIMLCGAAPTCMFPHSGIPPSSRDHPPRLDRDCGSDKEKTGGRKRHDHWKGKMCVMCFYLMQQIHRFTFHMCKGWVGASLPLFGGGVGWRSSRRPATHHWDRKEEQFRSKSTPLKQNTLTGSYDSKRYNQPADKMHLISTEDIQYQPLISVWELHILEKDGSR